MVENPMSRPGNAASQPDAKGKPGSSHAPGNEVVEVDAKPFIDANAEARHHFGRFNLAVIGNTGVGKSSLINAVFGRDLAKVGKGMPVTSGVHYYHDQSLGIWDFEGFEIGSTQSPGETLRGHLAKIAKGPKEQRISAVWYCVLSQADRLTQPDVAMIRELHESGLPVLVVLTKVNWSKSTIGGFKPPEDVEKFKQWLENPVEDDGSRIHVPIERVVLTSTVGKHGKGAGHGLGELVEETLALSPEDEKDAFRIAQRLNLPWKRQLARPVIAAGSASAAAAAAVPIPIADAATIAPIQIAMMGRISAIYDLDLKMMVSLSGLAQLGAQFAGQALARSFLKLIPGVGSVVNASVAGALTAAIGESWMRFCEAVHTGKVDMSRVGDVWKEYLPGFLDVAKQMAVRGVRRK